MAKQEIYQESEKIYNEKVTNIMEVMKATCQETIRKAKTSYIKIKGLYERGILSFYEDEKKSFYEEILEKKQEKKTDFLLNYQTPVKDLRRSPSFSNFDSEVRVESTEEKKHMNKNFNSDPKKSKNAVKYLTFNEKNEENEISAKKTRKNDDSLLNVETLLKKMANQQDEILEYSMKSLKNDSGKNSEYEMNARIKNEELKIGETLNYSKKSSEYEMNCRVIDSRANNNNNNNSGQSLKNSQGLFLKKSNELNLRGKIRYSDE